jgi:phage repressor protein C with HTH and peptisase S24 domain
MCEVVMISGNSMSPEYRHGDRVIIDKGDTELADGHIFAFRYQGQCYVKEINLLGNRIKCISLNKEYDPFYINEDEDFLVFGRIIPRIRL